MGIVSAIERQIHYFKTQCDVHITEKERNGGFEEKCAALKLLDCSCKMPTKGIAICLLLNILANTWNIFYSCNLTFHTFSRKGVITFSIKAFVSDFYI